MNFKSHHCGRKDGFLWKGEGRDDDHNLDNFDFLDHHQNRPQIFCLRTLIRGKEMGNSSCE